MIRIIGILGIFPVSAIAGLIVYTAIYNTKIKRQLASGNTTGRQWPQPKNILMIVLIVALSIVCILSVINSSGNSNRSIVNANNVGNVRPYLSSELQGSHFEHYIEAFETGKLTGYTLTEATENEFHYMYFRSNDEFDILHPSFVLFVEYTGEENYNGYIYSSGIFSGAEGGVSWMSDGKTPEYFCIVGNVDHMHGYDATFELCLYNTEEDALEELNRITASENENEPISNAKKSITFLTTEDSVLVCK